MISRRGSFAVAALFGGIGRVAAVSLRRQGCAGAATAPLLQLSQNTA